jgi:hypothetical protein
VNVGSTHTRAHHANQHFIVANTRLGNVAHHETRSRRFLHKSFHSD